MAMKADTNKQSGPLITATAQQSRFHSATFDAGANLDLELLDVNLAIGDLEVLDGANIVLRSGVRYGLTGRNGSGKSSKSDPSHLTLQTGLTGGSDFARTGRPPHSGHSTITKDASRHASGPRTGRGRHLSAAVCARRPRRATESDRGAG